MIRLKRQKRADFIKRNIYVNQLPGICREIFRDPPIINSRSVISAFVQVAQPDGSYYGFTGASWSHTFQSILGQIFAILG
jgi:hypothetical protein